ncbi:hypothetical protein B0H13DRAFT_2291924 [Mycena leptocephala]|nr:hypothetical protein B0H13DRAFT_2291924 [Mycena leptocephala]
MIEVQIKTDAPNAPLTPRASVAARREVPSSQKRWASSARSSVSFQTAAPAARCSMLNLIFSLLYSNGEGLISAAFNMPLPKLYAVSMMRTLNARRSLQAAHNAHHALGKAFRGALTTSNWVHCG